MNIRVLLAGGLLLMAVIGSSAALPEQVRVEGGIVQGIPGGDSAVRIFKGIPFAAPPVGDLRWKPPQPVQKWGSVRAATEFGQHCMQNNVYGDMVFRDKGPSEDCLYLNVWTPAKSEKDRLPVLVYVYGGGFAAGAASEARYDGENLAKKGVIVVNMNYRLSTFGFFSHPELTKESAHKASGNYGLMDQVAALDWVRKNIKAFGGDPNKVTIGGESAGSFSVSAIMASPLSKRLIHGAIGESGAFFTSGKGTLAASPLAVSEQAGLEFAKQLGADSIAALRAKSAEEILKASPKTDDGPFQPNIDGYFLPREVSLIYQEAEQSQIPLLAGWNADEAKIWFRQSHKVTVAQFTEQAKQVFGDKAGEFLKLYPAATDAEAQRSAEDYADDEFIVYSTWAWLQAQAKTGKSPVYCYSFDQIRPVAADSKIPQSEMGAVHASELEYVFQALASLNVPVRDEDNKAADAISSYFANFIKMGNPNGSGLPAWPAYAPKDYPVMHIAAESHVAPELHRARWEFLNSYAPFRAKQ
jgi:para-nitrobenzyl esterase